MKANGIERDFLKEVREARPEDCKTIIEALHALEGREDEAGEAVLRNALHTERRGNLDCVRRKQVF